MRSEGWGTNVSHQLAEFIDEDGWDIAVCGCGERSPQCPGKEEAANFWGQHLLAVTRPEPEPDPSPISGPP